MKVLFLEAILSKRTNLNNFIFDICNRPVSKTTYEKSPLMQVVRGTYLQYHEQLTGSSEYNPKKRSHQMIEVSWLSKIISLYLFVILRPLQCPNANRVIESRLYRKVQRQAARR